MEIILLLATILIIGLVLSWFFKVTTATIKNGVIIIIILVVLYLVFKITPAQVWEQMQQIFQGKR
ncbi:MULTISPECIES: hypothetical protein [Synechocystis]|uniref:Uncharacterized protein n=1 Tax=Synechocystis salina LEGE 00031 TaxID=1828736 RepID=A0ABR9VQW2_9SYNC|nr:MULTISPECIES: hypothetical protein [Synechocystis]MBD2652959.1 hypothetical protein [Synechocystis sp. FACHB-383]MBE9195121.1 hypothetical protein [Synechocystis sp. LEGE 06083]MBE9242105.1 hypothetical protein [Synechocystis salina LEGE 00041]MBE9252908.1 hypothetical protein [Synechocystis salina LEGE 00031]